MVDPWWITFIIVVPCLVGVLDASTGDADPLYQDCVGECERTGCVGEKCFAHCKFPLDYSSIDGPRYMQEPLYLRWKKWDCQSDCRYHCMLEREKERAALNQGPVKYHGKWPFQRLYGFQEPVSVALSALNLAMHFHVGEFLVPLLVIVVTCGFLCYLFVTLGQLYHSPLSLYKQFQILRLEITRFFVASPILIYMLAVLMCVELVIYRDVELTERLDYSSAVAALGYSLILSILRSFNVRDEAGRVMVAAPLIAFIITHILYLNNYKMDYGWNMKVCAVMAVTQLLVWAVWGVATHHPSRWKLWIVVVGDGFAMLLEIYDFPPYKGFLDAHAIWHATTIPLTYFWWSFIRDDAEFRTYNLVKKLK